ncbi:Log1p [Sporobolomyces koalae]|uniref:Log1p n=1 Tax=Sporobolomyces koalae TaxID=500713 RepID=UPI00317F407A
MTSTPTNRPDGPGLPPADPESGITVFCGSSPGHDRVYLEVATCLARAIAKSGKTLVYGGGTMGLMGQVAKSALEANGKVHGIIPSAFLTHEAPDRASKLHPNEVETVCSSMHERKRMFADRSNAFVGLPGGYGTCEELFEMTTWSQLGIHKKPVVLLNVNEFYTPLRQFIEGAISAGFISPSNRNFLIFVDSPPPSTMPAGESVVSSFDWGEAALRAIEEWHRLGTGGAEPFKLDWNDQEQQDKSRYV